MLWLHCNYCGVQPAEVDGGIQTFVTSCSHTFCKSCVDYVLQHRKCLQCDKQPVHCVKVEANMNPQVKCMFGSVIGSLKVVARVLEFQARHEDLLEGLLKKSTSDLKEKKSGMEEQNAELTRQVSSEDGRLSRILQERDRLLEELRRLEEEAQVREDACQPGSPNSVLSEEAMSPSASRNVSAISYNTTVGNVFKMIKTPDFFRPKSSFEPRTEAESNKDRFPLGNVIKASGHNNFPRAGDQVCHQPSHHLSVNFPRIQVSKMAPWTKQRAPDRPLPASSNLPRQSAASQLHSAFSPIPRPTEAPFMVKSSAAPAWRPGLARKQKPAVPKPFSAPPARPVPALRPTLVLNQFLPTTSTPKHSYLASSIPKPMLSRHTFLTNKFHNFA